MRNCTRCNIEIRGGNEAMHVYGYSESYRTQFERYKISFCMKCWEIITGPPAIWHQIAYKIDKTQQPKNYLITPNISMIANHSGYFSTAKLTKEEFVKFIGEYWYNKLIKGNNS